MIIIIDTGKITKYENSALEIKNIWQLNNVSVYPWSSQLKIATCFPTYLQNIGLTKNILRVGQKSEKQYYYKRIIQYTNS
jgi:hypothetical protein